MLSEKNRVERINLKNNNKKSQWMEYYNQGLLILASNRYKRIDKRWEFFLIYL